MLEYDVLEKQGDVARLRLGGELVAEQRIDLLERVVKRHFLDDGVTGVVLEVGDLRLLDEDGLAALMRLRSDARRRGKRLFIDGAQGRVRTKLTVAGILQKLARGD